ncbi:MAG: GNAT family N-acetyltransferase [Clostridia bacterium]|nr:GNAT family N-acetyltransferase [Clostridia bacterium]
MQLNVKFFNELTNINLYNVLKIRAEVFVVEQKCIYNDMDDEDINSLHVYFEKDNDVKAYLRIIPIDDNTVKIGRVCCLQKRTGLGTRLLKEGIKAACEKLNAKKIIVHAQSYVENFYAKQGFKTVSDEFMEEGIPHVKMELELK